MTTLFLFFLPSRIQSWKRPSASLAHSSFTRSAIRRKISRQLSAEAVHRMNKSVAITGGFGVLGVAVGRRFASAGWHVALIGRGAPDKDLASGFAGHLLLGGADMTDLDSARSALEQVAKEGGGLHALINVAGGFRFETLAEGDLATWDAMYQTNLRTAVTASKAALVHLAANGSGRIVNVAAGAAVKASAGMGAYAASKAGVMRFTEALAEELKDRGVTVNAVMPSIIDTPQNRRDMPGSDFARWVAPAALAEVIFFLASDAASAVTGACLPVTGRV
jgi:NAD(P)-dependent dehydrogenase (short-subunit alcohol dehydrogenase family)